MNNTWNRITSSLVGIDPQLTDQIFDFVANGNLNLSFSLPDPELTAGLPVVGSTPDSFPTTSGANPQPTTSSDPQYDWQVRYWLNGTPQNPTTTEGNNKPSGTASTATWPLRHFTRIKEGQWRHNPVYTTSAPFSLITPGVIQLGSNTLWSNNAPAYTASIAAAGAQIVEFSASNYPNDTAYTDPTVAANIPEFVAYAWPGSSLGASVGGNNDPKVAQNFLTFQQAKAIVLVGVNSATPSISTANPTYTNILATDHLVFDASNSYGGGTPSEGYIPYQWIVQKSTDGGATWITAAPLGVDYTLNAGTMASNGMINLNFVAPGPNMPAIYYRVTFTVIGYSTIVAGDPTRTNPYVDPTNGITGGGDSGPNQDSWYAIVQVVDPSTITTFTSYTTLPNVTPSVTVVSSNPVTTSSPLVATGVTTLQVEGLIDATAALKKEGQTVYSVSSGNATVYLQTATTLISPVSAILPASDGRVANWVNELMISCSIQVQLRQYNGTIANVIQTKMGLGPHTFTVNPGSYDVAFVITSKPTVVVPSSLESTATVLNVRGPEGGLVLGS